MTEWDNFWKDLTYLENAEGLSNYETIMTIREDLLRIKVEGDKMQEELKSAHEFHRWATANINEAIKDVEKRNEEMVAIAELMKEVLDK